MWNPGDHKVICDECGMTYLRSECRKDWKGRIVCSSNCWEPRHPQDFVRGKPDITRVENPRPDISYNIGETTLGENAAILDRYVILTSSSGVSKYDGIGITLDNGEIQWTHITSSPLYDLVLISDRLRGAAAAGNVVYLTAVGQITFSSFGDADTDLVVNGDFDSEATWILGDDWSYDTPNGQVDWTFSGANVAKNKMIETISVSTGARCLVVYQTSNMSSGGVFPYCGSYVVSKGKTVSSDGTHYDIITSTGTTFGFMCTAGSGSINHVGVYEIV